MEHRSDFLPKLLLRFPEFIGIFSAIETFRRAGDSFFASPPLLFSRALVANPRAIGAACPSSVKLARAIADLVTPPDDPSLVLELGGGTGMVTAALLERGVAPDKLVVVELDRHLARHLKNRFPQVAVIHGNAIKLCQLCNRYDRYINTVVSSLPLLSLPASAAAALGGELQKIQGPEGSLIQYTYRLNNRPSPLAAYLERVSAQTVWCNLPPAKVEVFRTRTGSTETAGGGNLA